MRSVELHGGVPAGQPGLRWLTDHAWPLWLAHGIDWRRGAFHEHLDSASLQCHSPFRRLRVAARQTYVFSGAARYGVPHAKEAVVFGLDFLRGPARPADGGFAWRFDLDNRPIDSTRDLYDHAFVLLAFAAAAEVVGADRVGAGMASIRRVVSWRTVCVGTAWFRTVVFGCGPKPSGSRRWRAGGPIASPGRWRPSTDILPERVSDCGLKEWTPGGAHLRNPRRPPSDGCVYR